MRFRSLRRRVLAVAASAAVGLVGAVALATPASAHHSEVKGVPYCDTATGEWVVTWTVTSFAPAGVGSYKLLEVQTTPAGTPVSNLAVTEGEVFPHSTGAPLQGEQRLPGNTESASLGVRAMWSNGYEESRVRSGEVTFGGLCEPDAPPPGPVDVQDASTCDELTVTVTNPEDGAEVTVQFTASDGESDEFVLGPAETFTTTIPAAADLTYQVSVDGELLAEGGWQDPGDCDTEIEVPIALLSDCDSLTVEVTNPLTDEALEATVSSGDVTETLVIEPGETGEVSFDAEAGTVATVTIGEVSEEFAWEQPEGCDEAPGEGGGLPVTGASTGIAIGAALALLVLGGGLFLVARRRRITFTA